MFVSHSVILSEKGSRARVQLARWLQHKKEIACECKSGGYRLAHYESIAQKLNSCRDILLELPIRYIINDLSRFSRKGIEGPKECDLEYSRHFIETDAEEEIDYTLSHTCVSLSEMRDIAATRG